MGRPFPSDVLEQAAQIVAATSQIDPALKIGSMSQSAFAAELTELQNLQAQINVLEKQLIDLRNQRDGRLSVIWDAIKRVRALVKGTYGDDSSAYELVGGTRLSERQSTARRPKPGSSAS